LGLERVFPNLATEALRILADVGGGSDLVRAHDLPIVDEEDGEPGSIEDLLDLGFSSAASVKSVSANLAEAMCLVAD
jgi:hypothetical protein